MRPQGFINNKSLHAGERRDCTVRALATATGRDYMEVWCTLNAAGRKTNRGFHIYEWLRDNNYLAFGCRFERATLGSSGTFLVGNRGHVWVMKDGIVYDSWGEGRGRRYSHCFRVWREHATESGPTAAEIAARPLWQAMAED